MIKRLYDKTMALAEHPKALWALFAVSFTESSFFPIPPDVMMIPMIIARRRRAFLIAGVATLASVLGALLGYYIGWGLLETVGRPIIEFYGKQDSFEAVTELFRANGALAVIVAGVTFLPFKVVTIVAGVAHMSLPVFVISAIFARALRFFLVSALLWKFGEPIRDLIERRLGLFFALFCVLLIGGFALLKFI